MKSKKISFSDLRLLYDEIGNHEKMSFVGGYDNDCFWRCISYLMGEAPTEANAAKYAELYFSNYYGVPYDATAILESRGAQTSKQQMLDFLGNLDKYGCTQIMFNEASIGIANSDKDMVHCVIIGEEDNNNQCGVYLDPSRYQGSSDSQFIPYTPFEGEILSIPRDRYGSSYFQYNLSQYNY